MLWKYFQSFTIVHICFAISFFTSGLIVSLIQASLFFTLKNFNKRLYRKINYYLSYSFYSQLVFMVEWWANSDVQIYIDQNDFNKYYGKEHGLLIMNHSYEIDWLIGWQFCDYIQVLGNCKAFAKQSIQYIPPIGWIWKFGEFIFLDRSYEKDKENIFKQINELGDYPDPIWLLLFPEGTRLSPSKLKASQEFAEGRNLPVLKHHLLPRTKGFVASLQGMREKVKVIYDIQIAFRKDEKVAPTMTSLLFGKPVNAHLYISRICVDDLPHDDEELGKWLFKHYEMKDRMQDSFYTTGDFFTNSGVKRIEPRLLGKRKWSILTTVCWNVVILVPMLGYIVNWLLSGELILFSIAFGILAIFYIAMKQLIGMSEIKKASSYGASTKKKD